MLTRDTIEAWIDVPLNKRRVKRSVREGMQHFDEIPKLQRYWLATAITWFMDVCKDHNAFDYAGQCIRAMIAGMPEQEPRKGEQSMDILIKAANVLLGTKR